MAETPEESIPASQHLRLLSVRVLFKTLIKCFLWFGSAWLITRIWPSIVWPWYVAWTFVAIGMGFSLLTLATAFYSFDRESRSGS